MHIAAAMVWEERRFAVSEKIQKKQKTKKAKFCILVFSPTCLEKGNEVEQKGQNS